MLFIGLDGFFSKDGFNIVVIILIPFLTFFYVIHCSDILSEGFSQSTISADQTADGAEEILKKKILKLETKILQLEKINFEMSKKLNKLEHQSVKK